MYSVKNLRGELVVLRVGDELVVPGIPQHKMIFVGAIGTLGENDGRCTAA